MIQVFLSNSYQSKRQVQERHFYWMERVETFPNSPDVLYNAALSALSVNKDETALRLLQQALSLDPLFSEAKNLQKQIIEDGR